MNNTEIQELWARLNELARRIKAIEDSDHTLNHSQAEAVIDLQRRVQYLELLQLLLQLQRT